MKRNYTIFILVLMLASINALFAQTGTYSGGGDGTSYAQAILISSTADLIELSNTEADWGLYFKQTQDLVFNDNEKMVDWDGDGTMEWTSGGDDEKGFKPIGSTWSNYFVGTYDGNGYEIKNLYINRPDNYAGLFGFAKKATVDTLIRDLGLINCEIYGNYAGALAGYVYEYAIIQNCYATGTVKANQGAGGLLYRLSGYSQLNSSHSSATVICHGEQAGGLVGIVYKGTFSNCYSNGYVTSRTEYGGSLYGSLSLTDADQPNCSYATGYTLNNFGLGYCGQVDSYLDNCYADYQTLNTEGGMHDNCKLSTSEFTNAANFHTDWNIDYTGGPDDDHPWLSNPNGRPYLYYQKAVVSNGATTGNISIGFTLNAYVLANSITINETGVRYTLGTNVNWVYQSNGTTAGSFSETISVNGFDAGDYVAQPYAKDTEGTYYYGDATVFTIDPTFSGGAGTENDPYHITSLSNLEDLANTPSFVGNKSFTQLNDINASATQNANYQNGEGFFPIGMSGATVADYYGNGYSIKNLFINRPYAPYVGLIAILSGDYYAKDTAYINNIILTNADITGGSKVGALAGRLYYSKIDSIYVSGTINASSYAGGVNGNGQYVYYNNCKADVNVIKTDLMVGTRFGGLTASVSSASITNCGVNGLVHGSGYSVGGLTGYFYQGTISASYSTAMVISNSYDHGGFVGQLYSSSHINDCYASGMVIAEYSTHEVGGFIGENQGTISNCYSTGTVIASGTNIGGFAGECTSNKGTLVNCFFDTETSGMASGIGTTANGQIATGLTTANFFSRDFTSDFNIIATPTSDDPWVSNVYGRPFLYSQSIGVDNKKGLYNGIRGYAVPNTGETVVEHGVKYYDPSDLYNEQWEQSGINSTEIVEVLTGIADNDIVYVQAYAKDSDDAYYYGDMTTSKSNGEPLHLEFDANGASGTMEFQGFKEAYPQHLRPVTFTKTGYEFINWSTMPDGTGDTYTDNESTALHYNRDTVLYAQWSIADYNISYNLDDGSNHASNPATYTYFDATIPMEDATKAYYAFNGWFNNVDLTNSITQITAGSTGDTIVYAKFTPIEYSITYNLDGGNNDAVNPSSYNYETATITLADADKTGYTFNGWFTDAGFTSSLTQITNNSNGNTTLYAKFTAIDYIITYNLDGGTNDVANPATYTVADATISLEAASKEYYTFNGWYTNTGLSNGISQITSGSTGDTIVYAKFTPTEYSITYNLDGGNNDAANPTSYNYEVATITLADADKTGYTFNGWFTDAGFTSSLTQITNNSNGNITLYAKFMAIDYNITYNLDGGTNDVANPATYTVADATISLEAASKDYYTFNGWFTNAGLSDGISQIASGSIGDTAVFAKFTPVEYSITYNLYGGSNDAANPSTYNYETATIVLTDASKTGYTFNGWFTDTGFTSSVTQITNNSNGNITLYAKFTAIDYNITYHLDAGTNDIANPSTYTVADATISLEDAAKDYYDFNGWFTNAGLTNSITQLASGSTGDTIVYAKFTPIEYSITYNLDGGSNDAANPSTYNYETAIIILADASKTGYTFNGWFTDTGFSNQLTEITNNSNGNETLFAKFVPIIYSINYQLDNGTNDAANPTSYTIEDADINFVDATRNGAAFLGWYYNAELSNTISKIATASTGDTTIYAKWDLTQYTIIYNLNGGTNHVNNPAIYDVEDAFDFATPTKTGYTFLGWYTDDAYITKITGIAEKSTGNIELWAKWELTEYTISYHLDAGNNASANPASYNYLSAAIILADASRIGANFLGWFTDASFTNQITEIAAGSTGNFDLYAKWQLIEYNITYNLNEGSNADSNPLLYTVEDQEVLAKATKKGYSFGGWFSDALFTVKIDTIKEGSTGNIELWAKWSLNNYAITYNLNDGTNADANPEVYTIESDEIVLVSANKTGYNFTAWYANENFTTIISSIAAESIGDTILWAKYETISYNISYNLNGGVNSAANPNNYTIEDEVNLANPSKKGYQFAGWYSNESLTEQISLIEAGSIGNMELWAAFERVDYTITYNLDGGVNSGSNPVGYSVDTTDIALSDAAKTGYTFKGWYAEESFTNKVDTIFAGSTGNNSIYAKWELNTYTITYNLNGGVNASSNPSEYTVESNEIKLAVPTKTGYSFAGWYSNDDFSIADSLIEANSTGNLVFYAKWSIIEYSIIYNLNGGINSTENPTVFTSESLDIIPAVADKNGYEFKGWYSNKACTISCDSIKQGTTGNMELWAKWQIVHYSITYNTNGGANAESNDTSYSVVSNTIVLTPAIKSGYTFNGWFADESMTTKKDSILTGTTGNIELWAKWSAKEYTIAYNLNGGENSDANPLSYTIENEQITLVDASRNGYTFEGWFTNSELTHQITVIEPVDLSNYELYAKWQIIEYTIAYNLDGGINANKNPDVYTVDTSFTFEMPTRDGFEFVGWFTDAEFTTEIQKIEIGTTGAMELWAKWNVVSTIAINNFEVNCYPNPVQNELFISFINSEFTGKVYIYNSKGALVNSVEVLQTKKLKLNTSLWSQGVYMVSIIGGDFSSTYKLVK